MSMLPLNYDRFATQYDAMKAQADFNAQKRAHDDALRDMAERAGKQPDDVIDAEWADITEIPLIGPPDSGD